MTPALIIALIEQVGIPELMAWLKSRHDAGQTIDDAAILEKLQMDTAEGIRIGQAWLDAHPQA
jgi:hypothetical protein